MERFRFSADEFRISFTIKMARLRFSEEAQVADWMTSKRVELGGGTWLDWDNVDSHVGGSREALQAS